jgi:hypothetical protein
MYACAMIITAPRVLLRKQEDGTVAKGKEYGRSWRNLILPTARVVGGMVSIAGPPVAKQITVFLHCHAVAAGRSMPAITLH